MVQDKVIVASNKPISNSGKGLFVKINMDGVPIGRKIDINAYESYEKLSSAVDDLFRGLLEGNILIFGSRLNAVTIVCKRWSMDGDQNVCVFTSKIWLTIQLEITIISGLKHTTKIATAGVIDCMQSISVIFKDLD